MRQHTYTDQQRQSATLIYSEELNPARWRERHLLGEVPGNFPYGLDRLTESGIRVQFETVRPAGRYPLAWAGILNPRYGRPRDVTPGATVMAWEESTAVPMLLRHGKTERRLMAGLIWATDAVSQGQKSTRLRLLRRTYRQMDAVWVLSQGQLTVLKEWLDVPVSRLHYVPFGIDTAFFLIEPMPEAPMVLSLGSDRDRDPITLINAMRIVRQKLPDTRIVVQSALSRLPAGIEPLPRLTGPQVKAWYSQATVVAIATRPNLHVSGMTTALEAMSTGRPVVLSSTPGAGDYVPDGRAGYLVPPGDAQAMAKAVINLLRRPELASEIGAAASAYVRSRHTESSMTESLGTISQS